MTARIAVTQRVVDLPDRNERRDALDQQWAPLLAAVDALAVPIPNRVADPGAFLHELGITGIVLSGGNDLAHLPGARDTAPERDALERELLVCAARDGLPVLGVCRGMQLLVTAACGSLGRDASHAGSTHELALTGPTTRPLRTGPVRSYHDWVVPVEGVPAEFRVLATAPDGTVEAIEHTAHAWVGTMWHPERDARDADDVALLRSLFGAP